MAQYLSFFVKDFSFSFVILMIGFIFGWIIYNKIVLKDVALKDALFEKDNLAVWIEFIGAFVFPVLYLAAQGIKGSASDNIFIDLGISVAYTVCYIVLLTILRILSKYVVNLINAQDGHGKVCLNKEICEQKNIGAALFSVSLTVIFVSLIQYVDILGFINGVGVSIAIKILVVLLFMLVALVSYCLFLRKKTTLFKELFIDNNAAAGVGLLGFVFAVQTIINGVISVYSMDFELLTVCLVIAFSLIIFGVLAVIFKAILTKLVKVDIWNEVYEQNNIGAAIGQVALYVGLANIIINFIS